MRVRLTGKQVDILDELGAKIKLHHGKELTRSQIVDALFQKIRHLDFDLRKV